MLQKLSSLPQIASRSLCYECDQVSAFFAWLAGTLPGRMRTLPRNFNLGAEARRSDVPVDVESNFRALRKSRARDQTVLAYAITRSWTTAPTSKDEVAHVPFRFSASSGTSRHAAISLRVYAVTSSFPLGCHVGTLLQIHLRQLFSPSF